MRLILSEEIPRFYGRRKGRKLSRTGIFAIKEGYKFILEYNTLSENFFKSKDKIILEIGFGDGENLVNSAKKNTDSFYLGADPFLNATAKCLKKILDNNLSNVKIWPDDVRKIINSFPSKSLSEVKLLFPDPWPKTKHKNRRLLQIEFINIIYKILKTEGTFTVATDHKILKSWILEKFQANSKFEWQAQVSKDWQNRPEDCFQTKYERKSLEEKRKPTWFVFKKK